MTIIIINCYSFIYFVHHLKAIPLVSKTRGVVDADTVKVVAIPNPNPASSQSVIQMEHGRLKLYLLNDVLIIAGEEQGSVELLELALILLITTIVAFKLFYQSTKSLLLGMKWVSKHRDLQIFVLKLI